MTLTESHSMTTHLEEKIAYLEHEVSQLSDELYAQQKEISLLREALERVNETIKNNSDGSPMRDASEETPPPHY